MLVVTTPNLEGKRIVRYLGLVSGEAIVGLEGFKDLGNPAVGGGGRQAAYGGELRRAKYAAVEEMKEQAAALGGNAVVGVDLDYENVGSTMLVVSATGTAVVYEG
jgi:uncharacterized protein YbjQ (UPF0145 family)